MVKFVLKRLGMMLIAMFMIPAKNLRVPLPARVVVAVLWVAAMAWVVASPWVLGA